MRKFFDVAWEWIRFIFSPESARRRDLSPGFQRECVSVWLFLTALFFFYQFAMAGKTYNLYLPYEIGWEWQKTEFPVLDVWLSALIWGYVSGLCLIPKATALLSSLVFSFYFLYGAANKAPVDFLLGFGEVIVYVLSPLLSSGQEKSLSAIWETLHFPGLAIYAFHFFLPLYVIFTAILTFIYFPARAAAPKRRPSWADLLLCAGGGSFIGGIHHELRRPGGSGGARPFGRTSSWGPSLSSSRSRCAAASWDGCSPCSGYFSFSTPCSATTFRAAFFTRGFPITRSSASFTESPESSASSRTSMRAMYSCSYCSGCFWRRRRWAMSSWIWLMPWWGGCGAGRRRRRSYRARSWARWWVAARPISSSPEPSRSPS